MVEQPTGSKISYEILDSLNVEGFQQAIVYDAIVLPPNLIGARGYADKNLHKWISDQHKSGATVCFACAGAFWLGHAGVLNGRSVTTHWALEPEFKLAFPNAHLFPEKIILDDHDIVTAGGVMAWVDLGIHLVRRWLGAEAVSRTCRQMLIDPAGREQRNYRSFRPNLTHNDNAIRDLQLWIEGNLNSDLSILVLAERAVISPRSLQRRFTDATDFSISQ